MNILSDQQRYFELVEQAIQAIITSEKPTELYDPIRYTLKGAGKRIRPVIALMACDLVGGKVQEAVNVAVSLELLHNFTLIHDDIMDQAPLRRGRETVYRKWNPNIAILAGDTMFAMAYDLLSKTRPEILPQVLAVFNRIAVQICEGQQYDMNFETDDNVSITQYLEMIRLKTAVFFGGCMQIGALLGRAKPKQADLLYKFGENLGMAFQLQDDLLDVFGSEETFGKQKGGDISANKKTFLYLKALELANPETETRLLNYYRTKPSESSTKVAEVIEIFEQLNVRLHTQATIEDYNRMALNHYDQIEADTLKMDSFRSFALHIVNREK